MRYPEGHKESVRAEILTHAARALRRFGLSGVSVPKLMKEAGLTHGGFYVHFANRDELVAEAVVAAAERTAASALAPDRGIEGVLDTYLSEPHVEHPEEGCVLAALGSDARNQSPPVRKAFARVARGFLEHVQTALGPKPKSGVSDEALRVASRMVGAIVLARLVDDRALAARIVAAARRP
ncbi:MAG: TetR/AcrR family transcriptional regulator [Labilithrix sp.]